MKRFFGGDCHLVAERPIGHKSNDENGAQRKKGLCQVLNLTK